MDYTNFLQLSLNLCFLAKNICEMLIIIDIKVTLIKEIGDTNESTLLHNRNDDQGW